MAGIVATETGGEGRGGYKFANHNVHDEDDGDEDFYDNEDFYEDNEDDDEDYDVTYPCLRSLFLKERNPTLWVLG